MCMVVCMLRGRLLLGISSIHLLSHTRKAIR
jgi:hypothetical protein